MEVLEIPLLNYCKVEAVSLSEEEINASDKLRLSFLEEESKHSRSRLNNMDKDTKFMLAQLKLITNWISSTFGTEIVDKESPNYKNWTRNHNLEEIETVAKLLTKASFEIGINPVQRRDCPSEEEFVLGDEAQDFQPEQAIFGETKRLPRRSCKVGVKYVETEEEVEEDPISCPFIIKEEPTLDPPSPSEDLILEDKDKDNNSDEDFDPSFFLDSAMSPEQIQNQTSSTTSNNAQTVQQHRAGTFWSHFITKRDQTNQITSNRCRYCKLQVSPRLYRLAEHIKEKCEEIESNVRRSALKYSTSQGHRNVDGVWSRYEWKAKDSVGSVSIEDCQTIRFRKESKRFDLFCKRCHINISPRLHRLKEHLLECGRPKIKKVHLHSPLSGRKSVQEIWCHFEWRQKTSAKPRLNCTKKKMPRESTNDFYKQRGYELICKVCQLVISPKLFRLRQHLAEECGRPKKKPKYSPNSGRRSKVEIWGHFEWSSREQMPQENAEMSQFAGMASENANTTEVGPKPDSIQSHKRRKSDLLCKYCQTRVCARVGRLVQHLRVCKLYKVDETRDSFLNADVYQQRRDDGLRKRAPKQCAECGKVVQGSLSRHMLTHKNTINIGEVKDASSLWASSEANYQAEIVDNSYN